MIFDVFYEASSTGVFVFGVELSLDSLLLLFHVFEFFFGCVFHAFVLVLEKVFEVEVSFINFGFDSLLGEFL